MCNWQYAKTLIQARLIHRRRFIGRACHHFRQELLDAVWFSCPTSDNLDSRLQRSIQKIYFSGWGFLLLLAADTLSAEPFSYVWAVSNFLEQHSITISACWFRTHYLIILSLIDRYLSNCISVLCNQFSSFSVPFLVPIPKAFWTFREALRLAKVASQQNALCELYQRLLTLLLPSVNFALFHLLDYSWKRFSNPLHLSSHKLMQLGFDEGANIDKSELRLKLELPLHNTE